ncbi:MAG: hypothetical protein KGI80_03980 [Verrucomicrobiota bacterium]|nr:hypothetical protein [Verrucomicrobiota bacterium]
MPQSVFSVGNVFNAVTKLNTQLSDTQTATLSSWNASLENWSTINKSISHSEISDPMVLVGTGNEDFLWASNGQSAHTNPGTVYLNSDAYQQLIKEWNTYKAQPGKSGTKLTDMYAVDPTLYKLVNTQCLLVMGNSLAGYAGNGETDPITNDPAYNQITGYDQLYHSNGTLDTFMSSLNAIPGGYLNAISSSFITYMEAFATNKTSSTDLSTLNSISSTVSSQASSNAQPSSNETNQVSSLVQQVSNFTNVISSISQQLGDVFSGLISSAMGKF